MMRKLTAGLLASGLVASLLIAGLGSAQDTARPVFAASPTFADVFEQVNPAVVAVVVNQAPVVVPTSSGRSPFAGTPFEDFFSFAVPNTGPMTEVPRGGEGSGFIIDPAGYIATNYHVVEGARSLQVTLSTGEQYEASVVGTDPTTDLALIKIDGPRGLPALRFGDSDQARIGEWVLAIGNPFGLGGSATAGIISARSRAISAGPYDDYLQIDAAINSGNSGGPIFNAAGEVIGINTAIYSPTGANVGIGFAIPANMARDVLDELRTDGNVNRGWLGIQMVVADEASARGVEIEAVQDSGPAAEAGLASGDVITSFNGRAVSTGRELSRMVGALDAGDEVDIEVLRDGDRREFTARLGQRQEEQVQASSQEPPERRLRPGQPDQQWEWRFRR
jgi:serine protease Do